LKNLFKKLFHKSSNMTLTITVGVIALFLVSSIIIQSKSVEEYKQSNIEGLRDDELKTQIATYKSKYEEAVNKTNDNMNKIQEYQNTTKENKQSANLIDEELEDTNKLLGLTEVTGKGLIITLKDTEYSNYTAEYLRNLINELKYAGAEAISINGNRIVNLTDIVTVTDGYNVIYGDTRIASPYIVKVIGDTTYLQSTLNMKNVGFVDIAKANALDIDIQESDKITVEKYNREITTEYMKEVE